MSSCDEFVLDLSPTLCFKPLHERVHLSLASRRHRSTLGGQLALDLFDHALSFVAGRLLCLLCLLCLLGIRLSSRGRVHGGLVGGVAGLVRSMIDRLLHLLHGFIL